MSSILKALKKLENEYPSSGYGGQLWLKDIDEKEAFFERFIGSLTTHQRFLIFTAVLLALISGTGIIYKAGYSKKAAAPVLSGKQQAEVVIPAPSLQNRTAAPAASPADESVLLKSFKKPNLPQTGSTKATARILSTSKPSQVPDPLAETSAISVRQPAVPQAASKASHPLAGLKPAKDSQTAESVSSHKISRPAEPAGTAGRKILIDVNTKLQAISWAENPENRLAVINNNIVRQGDRVGEYIVEKINKDDILVRREKEVLILPFRPR